MHSYIEAKTALVFYPFLTFRARAKISVNYDDEPLSFITFFTRQPTCLSSFLINVKSVSQSPTGSRRSTLTNRKCAPPIQPPWPITAASLVNHPTSSRTYRPMWSLSIRKRPKHRLKSPRAIPVRLLRRRIQLHRGSMTFRQLRVLHYVVLNVVLIIVIHAICVSGHSLRVQLL